jgi:hypothetical protein
MANESQTTNGEQSQAQDQVQTSDASGTSAALPSPASQDSKPSSKLTPAEFRKYNRLSETMNYYVTLPEPRPSP